MSRKRGVEEDVDDSTKLAHLVLARVNLNYMCANGLMVQPLSLMYEILRGWRMPELFEQKASQQGAAAAQG